MPAFAVVLAVLVMVTTAEGAVLVKALAILAVVGAIVWLAQRRYAESDASP